ncbi:PREDICTED: venom peptide BmKAPI-like [Dinoponera quadriceps]|uniref:Venom peptide BmKAPI-like n=1 Tax=Dinoponera quadriceps TaxID=609295 RepID=A0A6P3XB73_DINQU|nr:PREDICTED: venom peptide BmKAPI-like [Dinoponera quadriceps]XP_014475512.1 PREDICTED: venom peptide BmKAPI-like [Dinoponera quadriceps]XP_014475513.1 PREDICTED: venom peptide BmKAPI-like [Dinoponera quadriceps]XP_014475514.1 PREDICTED: venom peptide BmKAPI-like [Dinoponera quadriceps]
MSRTVLILLVVGTVLSIANGLSLLKCKKNEEWTECGSWCQPTCCEKEPKVCPAVCVRRCQCKSGYLRNSRGECVLPCDCNCTATSQRRCGRHEKWTTCGTPCSSGCSSQTRRACAQQCFTGCQCKQGFLLNAAGVCVPRNKC